MADIFFVILIVAVFAVAAMFARGCEKLEKRAQMIDYIWTGIVCMLLLAYLVYALLKPEKF